MYVKSYKELIIWKKSMELVIEVYRLTKFFPKEELFGIILQIRRAVVSIPSNIAEGYGRKSRNEFYQHLGIAYGSLLELETQLTLSRELKFAPPNEFLLAEKLIEEIAKMLNSMHIRFRQANPKR